METTFLQKKLAILIQEVLCKTDEYDRDGSREVPLLDSWGEIQEAIEDALGIDHGTLTRLGTEGACEDEECNSCGEGN